MARGAPSGVPARVRDATGVPQFYPNSGVCWYATVCWVSFANPKMCALVTPRMPTELRARAERAIYSRDAAEELRKALWFDYQVGDNVMDPPEMDGRNGFQEFTTLMGKLHVPMRRYSEYEGKLELLNNLTRDRANKPVKIASPESNACPHILVFRFQDGDHKKFPVRRRIEVSGCRYELVGWYAGQKLCGHQIGVAVVGDTWRHMAITDADLHKDGVGPVFVHFDGPQWDGDAWWGAWEKLTHVTKFGNDRPCNLSPHNPPNASLDRYFRRASNVGTCSIDLVYVSS